MTKKLVGLFASVALLGSGMALAEDAQGTSQPSQQQQVGSDYGGSGSQAQMQGQPMGEKQVSGKVLKSTANEVHLLTDNGVIAVKVNKDTKFQDPNIKRARDLKEGQQVRTSFTVEQTNNVARSITLDTGAGMGGAGGLLDSDQGINQPADSGGSGMEQDVGGAGQMGDDTGKKGDQAH
jgi:hypothetical protein